MTIVICNRLVITVKSGKNNNNNKNKQTDNKQHQKKKKTLPFSKDTTTEC